MTRYLFVMLALLAGIFVTAALVMPTSDAPQLASCNGVADYPVQRLAEGGDIDAMAFLGERRMRAAGPRAGLAISGACRSSGP